MDVDGARPAVSRIVATIALNAHPDRLVIHRSAAYVTSFRDSKLIEVSISRNQA